MDQDRADALAAAVPGAAGQAGRDIDGRAESEHRDDDNNDNDGCTESCDDNRSAGARTRRDERDSSRRGGDAEVRGSRDRLDDRRA